MRLLSLILILVFLLSGLGCQQSQEEPAATQENKVEKTPELSDEEKEKLKSLGYVE